MLVLIVGTISAYWLRYKWRIIVSALVTMIFLANLMGIITQGDVLMRISFHVFTGSFIFMVFFMATEPQSTPMPELSQLIFGILFTPFLDKIGYRIPYGFQKPGGPNHA